MSYNFVQLVVDFINFIIDVLIAVGTFFADLIGWMAEQGMNLVAAIAAAVLLAVEAILKAIFLALVFLTLALTLIEMVLMWSIFLVSFLVLSLETPGTLNVFLFGFEYTSIDSSFSIKYEESIQWRFIDFFDLNLPVVRTEISQDGELISWEENFILMMRTETSENDISLIEEDSSPQSSSQSMPTSSSLPTINSIVTNEPLEYGETAVITVDATDDVGIEQVIIEIEGQEYSMVNTGGNIWSYESWTPEKIGINDFTIKVEDVDHNIFIQSSSIEVIVSDGTKGILIGRIAAGASLAMVGGGIMLGLFGLIPLIENEGIKPALKMAVFWIGLLNLLVSGALFIRNIRDHANRPEQDLQRELNDDAYFYGFIMGCIITAFIFMISAAVGAIGQSLLSEPQEGIKKILKPVGGIIFGMIFLLIKLFELSVYGISSVIGANIVWVVLSLLLGGAILTTIGMIAKKDTRTAKWVGVSGVGFFVVAAICAIVFLTSVPQQNIDIITNLF